MIVIKECMSTGSPPIVRLLNIKEKCIITNKGGVIMSIVEKLRGSFKIGEIYPVESLPPEVKESVSLAIQARERAYANISHFKVGCVLKGKNGGSFIGANYEPIHCKGSCAEYAAILGWNNNGRPEEIAYVVTVGTHASLPPSEDQFTTPCGDCRQQLVEHFASETPVISLNQTFEKFKFYTLDSLLPDAFSPKVLK